MAWTGDRAALRKTVSVDERLLQVTAGEQPHLRLLRRLERGKKKLRSIQVSSAGHLTASGLSQRFFLFVMFGRCLRPIELTVRAVTHDPLERDDN